MSSHLVRTEKCEDKDNDEVDEFSYDDLEGIDLDSIPELCLPPTRLSPQPPRPQLSQVTDPQRLESSSLLRVVEPSACPVPTSTVADNLNATEATPPDSTGRSTTPSTDYGLEDEVDDEFLKELDNLESQLLASTNQSGTCCTISLSRNIFCTIINLSSSGKPAVPSSNANAPAPTAIAGMITI